MNPQLEELKPFGGRPCDGPGLISSVPFAPLAFESWLQRDADEGVRDAWLGSEQLKASIDVWQHIGGTCSLCGASAGFVLADGADPHRPDPREDLLCPSCHANARTRAALRLLLNHLAPMQRPPEVYLTEQATRPFLWLHRNLRGRLHGSEFEPSLLRRLVMTGKFIAAGGRSMIRFQDVTRLGFGDASLDAIASFDVLEHVPDYRQAAREFARTLRPGGVCIATFPFTDQASTLVRATVDEHGQVSHLLPPEYHHDPIGNGVLCFHHFGWDILDVFGEAGFRDARMAMPCSPQHGLFYGLWTLVATR